MSTNSEAQDDPLIVGIDLGTTNSAVGAVDSGFPILLADEVGQRLTPSAAAFPESGGDPIVGAAALRSRAVDPERTVTSIKRLIGRRVGEIQDADQFPQRILGAAADPVRILIGDEARSPEEISALILGRLRAIAEAAMGAPVSRAVITVPAYFNDGQRSATVRAAELAGLKVERILNEPTAAALAYGLDKLESRSKIAVYDFGGGTFDLSILDLVDGVFEVIATHGDTRLGGDDIDRRVAEFLWREAGGDGALDAAPPDVRIRLVEAAEAAKIRLSEEPETTVRLPFLPGGRSAEIALTRERLQQLAEPVISRTARHCRQAMADAGLRPDDLDAVVLVGGSTRIPAVRRLAADIFNREPDISQNPDEAVALGAVIHAGVLSGALRRIVLLDVTPLSLGIETFGGLMNVIIPRNTTIPAKAGEMFTNAASGQREMLIRILQGEREMARDNWELGNLVVPFTPGPKGSARVGVQFRIDENGILEVLARDTATGTDQIMEIRNAAVNVDDEKVERMVSESVDHAFEDMNARIFTEQKMKADELLRAVDQAFAASGDAVPAEERDAIEAAARDVRDALASNDARRLKAANSALDAATEPLAARLVAAALEAEG